MTAYSDKDDAELASFICQGNEVAFAELVYRHTDRFFALALRTLGQQNDAEDVVQSAFIKFWRRPDQWQADRSKFTTWFYRVVLNACHDLQRRQKKSINMDAESLDVLVGSIQSEESLAERRELEQWRQKCVEYGVQALPIAQRDALNLVVYCELPQKQAALIMGVKLKALESTLQRAKKNLRSYVEQQILESKQLESKNEKVMYGK